MRAARQLLVRSSSARPAGLRSCGRAASQLRLPSWSLAAPLSSSAPFAAPASEAATDAPKEAEKAATAVRESMAFLSTEELLRGRSLADVLVSRQGRSDDPVAHLVTCSETTKVGAAVYTLVDAHASAFLVTEGSSTDASAPVKGIVSEKDYLTRIQHGSFPPEDVTVGQITTPGIIAAPPSAPVIETLRFLLSSGFRHLPVLTSAAADREIRVATHTTSSSSSSSSAPHPSIVVSDIQAILSIKDLVRYILKLRRGAERLRRRAAEGAAAEDDAADAATASSTASSSSSSAANPADGATGSSVASDHHASSSGSDSDTLPRSSSGPLGPSASSSSSSSSSASSSSKAGKGLGAGSAPAVGDSSDDEASVFDPEELVRFEERETKADLAAFGKRVVDAEDVLELQRAEGRDLLLNTRLEDNITVADAANAMAQRGVSCVAVVDDDDALVGIFTTKDFLERVVAPVDADGHPVAPLDAANTLVRDVMTVGVRAAKSHWTVDRCARTMVKRSFRHLPVVATDTSKPLGILSLSDTGRVLARFTKARRAGAKPTDASSTATAPSSSSSSSTSSSASPASETTSTGAAASGTSAPASVAATATATAAGGGGGGGAAGVASGATAGNGAAAAAGSSRQVTGGVVHSVRKYLSLFIHSEEKATPSSSSAAASASASASKPASAGPVPVGKSSER